MQKQERIGILGGIFDPPSYSHFNMAIEAINNNFLDKMILVPCGRRKDRPEISSPQHRFNMLKIAQEEFILKESGLEKLILIDDVEIQEQQSINTYDLIKHYQNTYQKAQIYFVISEILLNDIYNWEHYQEMKTQFHFLIFSFDKLSQIQYSDYFDYYQVMYTTFIASDCFNLKNRIISIYNNNNNNNNSNNYNENQQTQQIKNTSIGCLPDQLQSLTNDISQKRQETNQLQKQYLGIYGLTPNKVIDYIRNNELYKN